MNELKYLVELNGLSDYFDLMLGTTRKYKSKIDHFNQIIRTQKPDLLIFLADSPEDMRIAKENNAIPIGIPTNHTTTELLTAGARYVCDLREVIKHIEKIIQ